jgi:hypothetical protein
VNDHCHPPPRAAVILYWMPRCDACCSMRDKRGEPTRSSEATWHSCGAAVLSLWSLATSAAMQQGSCCHAVTACFGIGIPELY